MRSNQILLFVTEFNISQQNNFYFEGLVCFTK